jgi:hypothetical protein
MTRTARPFVWCLMLSALAATPAGAQAVECSPVVKNGACTVTINRESPSTPQPFLMTGHAPITISIRKRPFDKIEVKSTFTDVTPVDPLAAIIGAFAPTFGSVIAATDKTSAFTSSEFKGINPPAPKHPKLWLDLEWIDSRQADAKTTLATATAALEKAADALATFAGQPAGTWTPVTLQQAAGEVIASLLQGEDVSVPSGVVAALGESVAAARKSYAGLGAAAPPVTDKDLSEMGRMLNGVEAHQALLDASAKSLVATQDAIRNARVILEKINASSASREKALLFSQTIDTNRRGPARSVKSTITLTDMLSKDKTDLGSISASWNSTRWELSAGTVFSARPITSYGVANSVITESNTRPMVVPFALAHYNLWETTAGRYRVALLASGGMGVNVNTKSADFGYGLSLGYRGVYLSALNHKARETVLSGGLVTGQTVASSVTTVPTELKWKSRPRLGIALTLRVPF